MAFIVFEGLDGSGKSTLIKSLVEVLAERGENYIVTREPGGTELSEEIRSMLIRTVGEAPTPRTELLLYEASRAQHVDTKIRPHLENGDWVICDRFTSSSVAFQAGGRHIQDADVKWLNDFATSGLKPDLEVLLDITVEESFRRREGRKNETGQEHDRFELEKAEFHNAVRDGYLKLVEENPKQWLVLDAQKDPEQLKKDLLSGLIERGLITQ